MASENPLGGVANRYGGFVCDCCDRYYLSSYPVAANLTHAP